MPAATPPVITTPFASGASGPDIQTPIPVSPGAPGRANYTQGFPPITMQPEIAGGIPPYGQDFNGVLFAATSYCAYIQAGQLFLYDAGVAAAIGGYGVGSVLGSTDGSTVWYNQQAANMSDPDAGGAGWVPLFSYGISSISGVTGGITTLTRQQARRSIIILNGVLVSNAQVVLPNDVRTWLVINNCTGAFTVTVKTAAGSGVTVVAGGAASPTSVYCDGNSIYQTQTPLAYAIDSAQTPNTIALRDNLGNLLAQRFYQAQGIENPAIGAVFVEDSIADGFLRKSSLVDFISQIKFSILANAALTGVPTAPTAAVGTNTTQVATTAFVQQQLAGGPSQTWQMFTSPARVIGTTYTNSTGRPIMVVVTLGLGSPSIAHFYVNGVAIAFSGTGSSNTNIPFSVIVPAGATYMVDSSFTLSYTWAELR